MFLLPLLLLWLLALGLAGRALRARRALRPTSFWRWMLLAVALLLVGLVVWSFIMIFTADSLW